jgi:transcriptional regulator with XRE-family HTH domain
METQLVPRSQVGKGPLPDDSAWDASRLREVWSRERRDQTQIAAALHVTVETLRQWRRGAYEPVGTKLQKLARILGVGILDLLPPE